MSVAVEIQAQSISAQSEGRSALLGAIYLSVREIRSSRYREGEIKSLLAEADLRDRNL